MPFTEWIFLFTVVLSIAWFYMISKSRVLLIAISVWTVIQVCLSLSGIYDDTEALPPPLLIYGILPAMVLTVFVLFNARGRRMIESINLRGLTYFHVIRIPVEIVLYLLYSQHLVSVYMSIEGTNFDIISGVTAPLVAYIAFPLTQHRKNLLLVWNAVGFLLLANVVITAVFAFPSPFQQLAFDQPNKALLHFPFSLLPTVVVPLVFLAHFIAFRRFSR